MLKHSIFTLFCTFIRFIFKFVRYHGCTGLLYLILKVTRLDNRVILLVDLYSAESTSNWLSAHFLTLISWRHVTSMLNDPDTNWPCVTRLKKLENLGPSWTRLGRITNPKTSDWNWATKKSRLKCYLFETIFLQTEDFSSKLVSKFIPEKFGIFLFVMFFKFKRLFSDFPGRYHLRSIMWTQLLNNYRNFNYACYWLFP